MPINNPEDSLPPIESTPDLGAAAPSVPSSVGGVAGGSPADPAPSIEFLPYVDEAEEKRKFWQAVFITIAVFFVVSVLIIGFIISQRLSAPAESKISVKYVDSSPAGNVTLPTRQPTRTPTPTPFISLRPTVPPLTRIPTSRPSPPRQVTYVVQNTGTPRVTVPVTSLTPTPTYNPSITLLPTMTSAPVPTATLTPTVSNTPTAIPTPTAYLYVDDTYNYSVVSPGNTTTKRFNLYNIGGSSLSISNVVIIDADNSAFSIIDDPACFTGIDMPVTIAQGTYKCVMVKAAPTYSTDNTGTLQIVWNGVYYKLISLIVTVPTATPIPTP